MRNISLRYFICPAIFFTACLTQYAHSATSIEMRKLEAAAAYIGYYFSQSDGMVLYFESQGVDISIYHEKYILKNKNSLEYMRAHEELSKAGTNPEQLIAITLGDPLVFMEQLMQGGLVNSEISPTDLCIGINNVSDDILSAIYQFRISMPDAYKTLISDD